MAKVFLSAGHGGKDPGAIGNGLQEKNVNLNILLSCKEELERHGVTVVCSRTRDENDPVSDEVKEANASKADIAVSFHTNAGGGDGSETFYYGSDANGKRLAELCEKHTKAIGQNSRKVANGSGLWFVKATNMTAVLCECAFIDNKTDVQIIDTTAEQKAFGIAYAKAILEYLGIAYKSESAKPVQEQPASNAFKVKVSIPNLNIRKGPGTNYAKTGKFTGIGEFTIVETAKGTGSNAGWGKLKSGAGWISLDHAKRV